MLIGNFSGAEQDLRHCVERVDTTAKRRLLSDLARVCLSQEKWAEYQEICTQLFKGYRDSNNTTELNALLWYSSLGNTLDADRLSVKTKLEALIVKQKISKSAYNNTLALCPRSRKHFCP